MDNPYETPKSRLSVNSPRNGLAKPILLLAQVYIAIKLVDYLLLMVDSIDLFFTIAYLEALLNLPLYIASVFYVLRFKSNYRMFWKICLIVAFSDQLYQTVKYFFEDPFWVWLTDELKYLPLYILAYLYSFKAEYIWQTKGNWCRCK